MEYPLAPEASTLFCFTNDCSGLERCIDVYKYDVAHFVVGVRASRDCFEVVHLRIHNFQDAYRLGRIARDKSFSLEPCDEFLMIGLLSSFLYCLGENESIRDALESTRTQFRIVDDMVTENPGIANVPVPDD